MDKEAGRRWRRRIREVLNTKWDPLGVANLGTAGGHLCDKPQKAA